MNNIWHPKYPSECVSCSTISILAVKIANLEKSLSLVSMLSSHPAIDLGSPLSCSFLSNDTGVPLSMVIKEPVSLMLFGEAFQKLDTRRASSNINRFRKLEAVHDTGIVCGSNCWYCLVVSITQLGLCNVKGIVGIASFSRLARKVSNDIWRHRQLFKYAVNCFEPGQGGIHRCRLEVIPEAYMLPSTESST